MALLLDLVVLSFRGLKRWTVPSVYLVLLVALSSAGGVALLGATQASPELSADVDAVSEEEDVGLIWLGRSWPGSERDAMSSGRVSSLVEVLRYLGCSVSPVIVYGEDAEKRISIGGNDYYVRTGLMGVDSEYLQVAGPALEVVRGRFFDVAEIDSDARVAVIGSSIASLANESLGESLPTEITVDGIAYAVVGVVADGLGYFSQDEKMRVSERIILPYTTLAGDVAALSHYALDLRAVVYKRPSSITSDFIDKVINDWLAQSDLSGRRFVSHLRSLSLAGSDATAVIRDARARVSAFVVPLWVVLFAALPAALLGYIRISERADELELMSATGASPLHLSLIAAMESFALVCLGGSVGMTLSLLLLLPFIGGITGLELAVDSSLRLSLVTALVSLLSAVAGGLGVIRHLGTYRRM
jgi:ABC-type antimicrobial peptide transport system permease subunit